MNDFKNRNVVFVYGKYPNDYLSLEIEHVSNKDESEVHIGGVKDVYIVNGVPQHLRNVFVACIITDGKITYMEDYYLENVFLKFSKSKQKDILSEDYDFYIP